MALGEVLEPHDDEPWPVRRVVALLLLAAVVLGIASAVDHEARTRAESALLECETSANAAVDRAWAPVVAMTAYVRPTLTQVRAGGTRDGILRLVADQALGRSEALGEVARRCAQIRTWWHHADLRGRQQRCLAAIAAQRDRLRSVAVDGRVAFASATRARCG